MKARYSPCFSVKGCRLERRDTPDFWFICRFVWASNQEAEMNVRYRVELSQAERDELTAMLSAGKHAARKLKRAQILLAADVGSSDEQIARTVVVGARPSIAPSGASGRAISNGRSPKSHVLERSASSPARKKPFWWQPPAPSLLRGAPAGHWSCWLARWSSSPTTRACRLRRFAGDWPKTT